jgi:hypothetical protein
LKLKKIPIGTLWRQRGQLITAIARAVGDLKWDWSAEVVASFETKWMNRVEQRKDVSVWVYNKDFDNKDFEEFVPFMGAEKLLHAIGWLAAMFGPWWIFVQIADTRAGSFLHGWLGWPPALIMLANSLFWLGYLMSRFARFARNEQD